MKTRIIQDEPEATPTETLTLDSTDADSRSTWIRRAVVTSAVVGYIVIGLVHPPDVKVGDETTLYIWLHLVQPVFILLLAWSLWLLVRDLPGRAAEVARLAILPFAIAYTTLDAIAGIATGMVIREANGMSASDGAAVQRVFDESGGLTEAVSIGVFAAAGLAWFVAVLAAAVAVKQVGGLGPSLLMATGAAIFALGHPWPPGPIGIVLFGLGVAWLELRREREPVPEAQPVPVP